MAGQIYQPHITSYDYDCPISEAGGIGQPGIGGDNKFKVRLETARAIRNPTGVLLHDMFDSVLQPRRLGPFGLAKMLALARSAYVCNEGDPGICLFECALMSCPVNCSSSVVS